MKLIDDLAYIAKRHKRFFTSLIVLFIPTVYILSGFYSVGQEQRAIVTRMGLVIEDNVMPGMHYHLPWPFESVQKLSSTNLRSISIDFSDGLAKYVQPELTTGDGNLVNLALAVQFNISEPSAYYNASVTSEAVLKQLAISETLYFVGANGFESLLTTGRTQFQKAIKSSVQKHATNYNLGVRITSIQIRRLEPPPSIKKGFDNVAVARSEKQKFIQQARGERSSALTKARSTATSTKLDAQAYAKEQIERANGDHRRFISMLEAYKEAPGLTMHRQYLEQLETIIAKTQVHVIRAQ
jgi:membrane protease subunit HflK